LKANIAESEVLRKDLYAKLISSFPQAAEAKIVSVPTYYDGTDLKLRTDEVAALRNTLDLGETHTLVVMKYDPSKDAMLFIGAVIPGKPRRLYPIPGALLEDNGGVRFSGNLFWPACWVALTVDIAVSRKIHELNLGRNGKHLRWQKQPPAVILVFPPSAEP
jgi:hypothetical protein